MAKPDTKKTELRPRSTTPAEWIAAISGAIIVALMVGCLVWYGLQDGNGPPDVTVGPRGPARPVSHGYAVEFVARNAGGGTAAQLNITGDLSIGGKVVEHSTAVIDYLPGHSERRGGLFFRKNPGDGQITIYATGYEKP